MIFLQNLSTVAYLPSTLEYHIPAYKNNRIMSKEILKKFLKNCEKVIDNSKQMLYNIQAAFLRAISSVG
jgi:hypothetical protein